MKKLSRILLVFIFLFALFTPYVVNASSNAKTLAELRKELKALQNKAATNKSNQSATKSKINSANNSISTKRSEIEKNTKDIADATAESEKLTVEIEEGKKELDGLVAAYQIASENNVYLEYLFDSKSYEDLVYRSALSEQVLDYISDKINAYQDKIIYNNELKVELAEKSVQLESDINSLATDIEKWDSYIDSLDDALVSIDDEISSTKELINYYVNIGCGENENLESCVAVKGDTKFIRPLTKGVVTSEFGYRTHPVTGKTSSFHSGTDIGGNSEGTSVYAIANGMVGKIIRKSSCGGNMVYVYHTIKGVKYTSCYMHLLTINVSVGQSVSSNTVVGTVGGGKGTASYETCSTGAHLHLSLATGWYGQTYTTYAQWKSHLVNPRNYVSLPSGRTYFYSRY